MNDTTSENLLRQERDDAVLAHHLALARIEALEAKHWRYRLYIRGYVRDGKAVDEAAALAASGPQVGG